MLKKFFEKRPVLLPLIVLMLLIVVYDSCFPVVLFRNHYVKHLNEDTREFKYVIKSKPKQTRKGNHLSYTAKVVSYYDKGDSLWHKCTGDIKIYIPRKDKSDKENPVLSFSDTIISNNRLNTIKNFDTSFDYVRYMKHQRIYHSVFANDFQLFRRGKTSTVFELSFDINSRLRNIIQSSGLNKRQSSIAVAMLLGDKTEMSDEVRQSFNSVGLAHILCVSGLHIMIIIGFFSFLFQWILPANLKWLYIKQIILILFSWIIAFIVGLTPSSMRVAGMLSLLFVGELVSHNTDRINILILTAFLFLILNPLILFSVSFQLSFLAVFGILALKPHINGFLNRYIAYKAYKRSNMLGKILSPVCSNVSTTLSAQIFCLPLLFWYFKSFPVLFLLVNLVAIPLAQIILISLTVFLFVSHVPILSLLLTYILKIGTDILFYVAEWGSRLF